MPGKRHIFSFGIVFISLLAITACSSDATNKNIGVQNSDGSTLIPNVENPSNETGSAGPGEAKDKTQIEAQDTEQPLSGKKTIYSDTTYKFSVTYPAEFALRAQPAEKLNGLKPKPIASFIFINPKAASSDIAELEPPDIEVRVYDAAGMTSLDAWLNSAGLMAGSNSQAFQTSNVSGVELCASTMIAPGCSYFVMKNGQVYELRPASLEGESIIKTFMFAQ